MTEPSALTAPTVVHERPIVRTRHDGIGMELMTIVSALLSSE